MSAKDIPGLEELLSQDEIDESFSNYDWKPWGELELSEMSEAFRKSSLPSNVRPGAVPRVSVPTKVPMCRSTQRPESQPPLPMPRVAFGLLWVHMWARPFLRRQCRSASLHDRVSSAPRQVRATVARATSCAAC